MPVSVAASTFGSPARQLPPHGYPPAAPPSSSPALTRPAPLQPSLLSQLPLAPMAPPAAATLAGSFSPTDASSVESADAAEELLGGLAGLGRQLPAGTAAAAALLSGAHAAPPPSPARPLGPSLAEPAADADGIDDVLRLQPWLE